MLSVLCMHWMPVVQHLHKHDEANPGKYTLPQCACCGSGGPCNVPTGDMLSFNPEIVHLAVTAANAYERAQPNNQQGPLRPQHSAGDAAQLH